MPFLLYIIKFTNLNKIVLTKFEEISNFYPLWEIWLFLLLIKSNINKKPRSSYILLNLINQINIINHPYLY